MDDFDSAHTTTSWAALANMAQSDWSALDERLDEAATHLAQGRSREAYDVAIWILERDEEFVPALRIAAFAALEQEQPKQARQIVDRMLALDPAEWRNHVTNAWVLMAEKKRSKASDEAVFALHVAPSDPDAYACCAELNLLIGGKGEIAKQSAERSLKLDPTGVAPRLVLAELKGRAGHFDTAIEWAEEALTFSPNHPRALAVLAWAQTRAGNKKQASETYSRIAERSPDSEYLKEPETQRGAIREAYGCARGAFLAVFGVPLFLMIFAKIDARLPLLVLTLVAGTVTAIAPVRKWIALRLNPRRVAAASTADTWAKQNPDIVRGLMWTSFFAGLLLFNVIAVWQSW